MSIPDKKQLLNWAENYVKLWNEHDKEGWEKNYRAVASGEVRMFDPVGTPRKTGFESCCLESWELFNSRVRFRIQPGTLFVLGNTVAWLLENHITVDGKEIVGLSIETYEFQEDGSLDIKTWYHVPERTEDELGQMFQEYLPE